MRCGECPLTHKWFSHERNQQMYDCRVKLKRGLSHTHSGDHECDVWIGELFFESHFAHDWANRLEQAIAMREAERNAVR